MKKLFSFLVALIMVGSCFAFQLPEADAIGTVWVKEFFKDKFGDVTDEFYLTNKSMFIGTYNSVTVSDGSLGAYLLFERDGDSLLAYIILFLNEQDKVKNGTSFDFDFEISVKRVDGSQFTTEGYMPSGTDKIEIYYEDTIELANALCASGDEIGIYIEDYSNALNNYVFKAKCSNFKDLYQQEIIIPYLEEQYQLANQLVNDKRYDEAVEIFDAIHDYKDSAVMSAEAVEKKNEEEYVKAEELLSQGRYDEARVIFDHLGNYKDSQQKAEEATEAIKANNVHATRLFNGKVEIATALEDAAKAYEATSGKRVEIESLGGGVDLQATLIKYYQAGNMPDIFVFEGKPDMANWTGMVVDMSDQPWAKDTEEGFVDESGALVGFPYTTEAIGLAYNKSILEKAGVDPKSITGPESMKAAFEVIDAKKAELGITAVIGYCANATELYWSTGMHLFGNYLDAGLARDDTKYFDMLMDGGKLDLDRFTPFAEMVGLFNQYSDPALLVSGNYDMQVSGFASGKYAFVTQGSWIGSSLTNDYKDQYASAGNFECGYVPYAFIEGIDTILTNAPSHWAVYKDGNVDEAEEFLNWLAGPDGQKIMVEQAGCVSPFKSCTAIANDPFAGPISEYTAASKTSSWHWMGQPANLAPDFTAAIFQDYAKGDIDTQGFIDDMVKTIPVCVKY